MIRKAKDEDIGPLMDLEAMAWDDDSIPYTQDQWDKYIGGDIVWCAVEDGEIIGAFVAIRETNNTLTLDKIFVHPDYRESGVGHNLMERFTASKGKARKAFLNVGIGDETAQSLFEDFGFEEADAPAPAGYFAMECRF